MLIASVSVFLYGCNLRPEQITIISQNAGLFSAVGWIAIDNPSPEVMQHMRVVLDTIEVKSKDIQQGVTYTSVVYPEVEKFINLELEPQYRPICKAGAISLLGGIDLLFASNPSWKENQDTAVEVISAFISGARNGLGLTGDSELLQLARSQAESRVSVLSQE